MNKSLFKQLILLTIGILLITFTYFIIPKQNALDLSKNKMKDEKSELNKIIDDGLSDNIQNIFKNVTYAGNDEEGNSYEIKADYAKIKKGFPDLTFMEGGVEAYIYLADGRIVKIVSLFATFDRLNQNMSFNENVIVIESTNKLTSDNLDFNTKKNLIISYNNVKFINDEGQILADEILGNLTNKTYKISMYNTDKVRAKILK